MEKTPGHADTNGFECIREAKIVQDERGFAKLELPRNNKKLVQTSLYLSSGWRANVDFQILLISADDGSVNIKDIARLTDYIVSYMCKGNQTQIQEKKK